METKLSLKSAKQLNPGVGNAFLSFQPGCTLAVNLTNIQLITHSFSTNVRYVTLTKILIQVTKHHRLPLIK